MNKEEKELLEYFLRQRRKKCIFFLFFIVGVVIIFAIGYQKYETKYNIGENLTNNTIQQNTIESQDNVFIEEKTLKNEIREQNLIPMENKQKEEIKVKENEKKQESLQSKPSNKDFLFSDGYNVNNVTAAAQKYLKDNKVSGKCIPIRDKEGIIIGMRVTVD